MGQEGYLIPDKMLLCDIDCDLHIESMDPALTCEALLVCGEVR